MTILLLILLSALLQIVAAWFALRINRIAGRPLAWILMSSALALMAVRRLFLLVEFHQNGFPAYLLPNEVMSFVISALLLGGVILIHGLFRAKAAEAASLEVARAGAREDADKLSAVLRATPLPTWIAEDPECRVVHGNPAAADLLRVPVDANHSASVAQEVGETQVAWTGHFRLVQHGRELRPDEMPMQRACLKGEEVREEPLDLIFDDGIVHHLMTYATPLRLGDGRIHGAVCCMVDLTEFRRVEGALAKAHKMESLGMLAGGLAHDFNNIFQVMVANLEMARSSAPGESPVRSYLDRLQAGLDRASNLSRDILHCSGGDLRRPESLDLSSLVAGVLDQVGLGVTRDLATVLPRVMMDPVLVGRVVEGLVTNALEANSAPGAVRVRTFMRQVTSVELAAGHWPEPVEPGLYAVLEVTDQGDGIDAATLPRIFDPFFSTRDMGRGLGLPAALGILRGHRGGIQVESIPGAGSVFRGYFPSPESLETPTVPPADGLPTRNLVLLADDEAELRSVLAEMLQEWFGLEVVCASDGQEALEIFNHRPEAFDLVFLDATMPRMNGVEAFRRMRQVRPGLPGILCSGYALPASREQAVAEGFADFLKKPFTSKELREILDRVLTSRA
ncbi:response regulator [Geothrix sp.]|uniref:hybrid sensor histidine kinase/response regulator n=1 Tax=Geothrix sp. TaxID=1962974 RepID=UPI0025B92F93|nr:response regulator [Geothrix sp.]